MTKNRTKNKKSVKKRKQKPTQDKKINLSKEQQEPIKEVSTETSKEQQEPIKEVSTETSKEQQEPVKEVSTETSKEQQEPVKEVSTETSKEQQEPVKELSTETSKEQQEPIKDKNIEYRHNKIRGFFNNNQKNRLKNINSKFILSLVGTAVISSVTTAAILGHYSSKDSRNINSEIEVNSQEENLIAFGEALEKKKILKVQPTYTIDPAYDYRFSNFSESILDSYIITSASTDLLQEIYVIKTNDTNLVHSELKKYAEELKKNTNSSNKKALDKTIIKTEGDYVYLIISENAEKIEKLLLKKIN